MILVDWGKFVLGKYKSKYDMIIMFVIIYYYLLIDLDFYGFLLLVCCIGWWKVYWKRDYDKCYDIGFEGV